jgi:olfactory receptor
MFFVLTLGFAECILLMVMAYDCCVAMCNPMHYSLVMNHKVYMQLVAASWISGIPVQIGQTYQIFPVCSSNKINEFFCDVPPVLQIVCGDTILNEIGTYLIVVVFLWFSFC